jgi:hypothetical protein
VPVEATIVETRPAEVRLRAGMSDPALRRKLERIRRYIERGRPVLVRTFARRSTRLDEETLLEQYEALGWTLRRLRWRTRTHLLTAREARVELVP